MHVLVFMGLFLIIITRAPWLICTTEIVSSEDIPVVPYSMQLILVPLKAVGILLISSIDSKGKASIAEFLKKRISVVLSITTADPA